MSYRNWYNVGGKGIEKAIQKTGSKDAWVLVNKGFENDSDYLEKSFLNTIKIKPG